MTIYTYVRHEYVRQGPDEWILILVSLPETFTQPNVTIQNTALDDFQALAQVFRQLSRGHCSVDDGLRACAALQLSEHMVSTINRSLQG